SAVEPRGLIDLLGYALKPGEKNDDVGAEGQPDSRDRDGDDRNGGLDEPLWPADAHERQHVIQKAEARIEEKEPDDGTDRSGDRDRARHHRPENTDPAQALIQEHREDEPQRDPDGHGIEREEPGRDQTRAERLGRDEVDVVIESVERRYQACGSGVVEAQVEGAAERDEDEDDEDGERRGEVGEADRARPEVTRRPPHHVAASTWLSYYPVVAPALEAH